MYPPPQIGDHVRLPAGVDAPCDVASALDNSVSVGVEMDDSSEKVEPWLDGYSDPLDASVSEEAVIVGLPDSAALDDVVAGPVLGVVVNCGADDTSLLACETGEE